ncbi:MAG: hypothetical protein V4671_15465 [Armatimonadota bacterium]
MQTHKFCGHPRSGIIVIAVLLLMMAPFLNRSIPQARATEEPAYHVYLFADDTVIDCSDACSYSENHVYSVTQPDPIGYRDGIDGAVVRDDEDNEIGYLAVP